MINHKEHFHGSDLEKIEQLYGIRKEDIINFGANVNPLGVSENMLHFLAEHLDAVASYPDREYTSLSGAIAEYCGTDAAYITVGNGATELISLLIQSLQPKNALLPSPTYSEYEREISLSGGSCRHFFLKPDNGFVLDVQTLETALTPDTDLLVLCNPNNPTSAFLSNDVMSVLLALCRNRNITVIVDETYVEFVADYPLASSVSLLTEYDNLIILRGISKFFAAPGLRLGYAITSDSALLSYLKKNQNPWTVNSLAELAGTFLFRDASYIEEVREIIRTERARVCAALSAIKGLKVFEPSANFVLLRIEQPGKNADMLFDAAIRKNMMIRNCSDFPSLDNTYFRFCFMNPTENDLLLSCIKHVLES